LVVLGGNHEMLVYSSPKLGHINVLSAKFTYIFSKQFTYYITIS